MIDDDKLKEVSGLLKSLIAIPSFSREETAAADFLQNYIEAKGIETGRKGNNIWCMSPGFRTDKPTILINSHIDTVRPVSSWTKEPFVPEETAGRIYGLGSNDAGASLVTLLHTFMELSRNDQPYNLIFLASCEEEVCGANGVVSALQELPAISFALVGEPTGMQPAIAEKGVMVLDVTAYGKAGHAAREEGENAIYKAMVDIEWFRNFKFDKVSPLLGPVKMSVTQINAGTQHNVVPDKCTMVVDVRSNELYSNEEIFEIIKANITSEAKARSFRLGSSRISPDHAFVRRAVEMGRVPYGSPTLSDQSQMPFPSLKMGPGQSSRSHTADEFIQTSELSEALDLYLQLLDGLVI